MWWGMGRLAAADRRIGTERASMSERLRWALLREWVKLFTLPGYPVASWGKCSSVASNGIFFPLAKVRGARTYKGFTAVGTQDICEIEWFTITREILER